MNPAALKKVTTRILVEFCAKDMRPFEIVSGDGFKKMAQHIWSMGAIYGKLDGWEDVSCILPHPTTISRNVAAIKQEKQQQIVPIIENTIFRGELSATTDMWTDDHKKNHFLTMTTHFFDEKFTLKRKVLFTSLFKKKMKSGNNIRKELKRRLQLMNLNPDSMLQIQFVTDQGSNVVKALKTPYKRKSCRAHLLNTILRNTFDSNRIPLIIMKTLIQCKKIVRYLKQSGKSNELSKCVVQDCETRWNYKLNMISSVVERYTEIKSKLSVKQLESWGIDLELARELISFLTPFKEACKSMEGDTYVTSTKILLWWADLLEHLNEEKFVLEPMKKVVRVARKFFKEKYVIDIDDKIACFLDPRYRSLNMLEEDERDDVYDQIKFLIEEVRNESSENLIDPPAKKRKFSCFEGSFDDDYLDDFKLYLKTADYSAYLKDKSTKQHIVELFWRDNQERFPNLYVLARKRLHVPASSGSSERVFSDAKRTYEPRRTNLEPDTLDDLLFIRDHFEDN